MQTEKRQESSLNGTVVVVSVYKWSCVVKVARK